jgi:hypothetical protein
MLEGSRVTQQHTNLLLVKIRVLKGRRRREALIVSQKGITTIIGRNKIWTDTRTTVLIVLKKTIF